MVATEPILTVTAFTLSIWRCHMERANAATEKAATIKATTWAGQAAALTSSLVDECKGGMGMEERSVLSGLCHRRGDACQSAD